MTDYTAVAPPSNLPGSFDPSSAFADALQRARQIAAKINTPGDSSSTGGTKRPLEETQMDHSGEIGLNRKENVSKKIAAMNDPIGAQLAAMQQQQRLGMGSMATITEEYEVPDKMVGLIIGRGGEQITRLQAESSCKIQMAAESGGLPNRQCTLTGSRKAKELIQQIVNRGGTSSAALDPGPVPDGHNVVEMMIPGSKVGLVIGKGGETIKSLQERAGVKMVMIQDGPQQTVHEKPLRISGEPQKCEYARQLVLDLLTERELEVCNNVNREFNNRNQSQNSEYGNQHSGSQEVSVPRQAVGVVIGKGGDMIKKIQQESGARIQFHQDDGPGDRLCYLSGSPEQIHLAQNMINDLINSVLTRDNQNMGRGRGRGRGGGGGGNSGGGFDNPRQSQGEFGGPGGGQGMGRNGSQSRSPIGDRVEIQYSVPANKCGIVIGKGGETIRTINQQSGAHVELARQPPANPAEKVFVIRGLPNQVEHAKQLIAEKIGMAPASGYNMSGPPSGNQGNYSQPGQQQQAPQQQNYTPQGWGNAYQHWQNQQAAPGDPSELDADPNAAAWAAYYAQYYGTQNPQVATSPQQGTQQPSGPSQPSAQPNQAGGGAGQSGQTDYSAAWADYYRSMGMFREAEMIEQQARASSQGPTAGQQPTPTQPPQQQSSGSTPSAGSSAPPGQNPAAASGGGSSGASQQQPQQQYVQYGQYSYPQQPAYAYNYAYTQQQYPQAPGTSQ